MKKLFYALLLILLACALSACGGGDNDGGDTSNNKADSNIPASRIQTTENDSRTDESESGKSADDIDVDLTKLSSTMVYSEVYNMMYAPDDYIGKTVKMKGAFTIAQMVVDGVAQPDPVAYACVIADATACCSQGLEFVLAGEYAYPNGYPELGTEITVVGTFQTYTENGFMYCHLIDAEMI